MKYSIYYFATISDFTTKYRQQPPVVHPTGGIFITIFKKGMMKTE